MDTHHHKLGVFPETTTNRRRERNEAAIVVTGGEKFPFGDALHAHCQSTREPFKLC